jgi:diketogulonate reductase-like aldo/keto reductase
MDKEQRSVRHVGVSNFPPQMVEEAARHAEVFCNQVEYHPYKPQNELLEQAKKMDYLRSWLTGP